MYFNVAVHRILKSNKFVYIKSGMAFLYLLQINKKLFSPFSKFIRGQLIKCDVRLVISMKYLQESP